MPSDHKKVAIAESRPNASNQRINEETWRTSCKVFRIGQTPQQSNLMPVREFPRIPSTLIVVKSRDTAAHVQIPLLD